MITSWFLQPPAVLVLVAGLAAVESGCSSPVDTPDTTQEVASLQAMAVRFAPADIAADVSGLPENERRALTKIIEAARVMDALFLRQVWSGNEAMQARLAADQTPLGRARLHYFLINKGPWSRLDHNTPFIPGLSPKSGGANLYPEDATKDDIEAWLKTLSEPDRARAMGFFTVIRRGPGGRGFVAVPYFTEYKGMVESAGAALKEAAALTTQPTLKRYLDTRADALLDDDYYESDVAWMELDASIEPTIGPYEVYEDEWFNAKAAYESFITIRDEAETKKLERFGAELQDIENHLPIDPKYRNPTLGALAPIRVVNEMFASGDANRGVQTAAFNLPNDERVIREKGSKRVMLKNVQETKFRQVLVPISSVALPSGDRGNVAFDAFFTHILMHELMHGLGPHDIHVGGRATTVRQELKETYSAVEEAKADISGLWAMRFLIEKGSLDRSFERTLYTTFLASTFRSIRFGINEAHGRGIAIQLNYLLDAGAVTVASDGTFAVNPSNINQAVTGLTREIMTLQAEGSYMKARALVDTLGVVRPEVQRVLDRLTHVPVDIEPRFVTAESLR